MPSSGHFAAVGSSHDARGTPQPSPRDPRFDGDLGELPDLPPSPPRRQPRREEEQPGSARRGSTGWGPPAASQQPGVGQGGARPAARNDNILCAVLALIKELDGQ